jgi:hypothetical protein
MTAQNVSSGLTVLLIIAMIWVRTRLQYSGLIRREPGRKLQLAKAGRLYFASAIALLAIGWFAAPALGTAFWPASSPNPALSRVIWSLLSYYVFIAVHRLLKSRGTAVFKARAAEPFPPP